MALDTSFGENNLGYNREPGYPKTTRRLEGRGSLAQIKTTHIDRFKIMVTSDDDIADIILGYLPFKVGDVWQNPNGNTDEPTLLTSITLNREPRVRRMWYADLEYEEGVLGEIPSDGSGNITNPDLLEPELSWSFETITKVFPYDAFGIPIETSAGERIILDQPITMPVLTIERYESWFDPSTIVDFVNHINVNPFFGAGQYQALCAGIEDRKATNVVFQGQYFRHVRYVFKFAVPYIPNAMVGHLSVLVDNGTYYLDANGNRVHFKAGGSDTTGNLDGAGGKAAEGVENLGLFSTFPLADFNVLGF